MALVGIVGVVGIIDLTGGNLLVAVPALVLFVKLLIRVVLRRSRGASNLGPGDP